VGARHLSKHLQKQALKVGRQKGSNATKNALSENAALLEKEKAKGK
jgi:hypothetical protein